MASNQILTALTALSSPVKPTDAKTLAGNMAALGNLGASDLLTVSIVSLIVQLQGFAGTDYRTNHAQLITDAASFEGVFTVLNYNEPANALQMQAALEWGAARAKVTTAPSTDVWSLISTGRDFSVMPIGTLRKIRLFLRYKLALLTV